MWLHHAASSRVIYPEYTQTLPTRVVHCLRLLPRTRGVPPPRKTQSVLGTFSSDKQAAPPTSTPPADITYTCVLELSDWTGSRMYVSTSPQRCTTRFSEKNVTRYRISDLPPRLRAAPHPSQISSYGGGRTEPLVVAGAGGGGGSRVGVPGGGLDGEIPGTKVSTVAFFVACVG